LFQRLAVIYVGLGDLEIQYLAQLIGYQVQFKAIEPTHRGFALGGYALEHFMVEYAFFGANPQRRRIDKGNTGALAQTTTFCENRHRQDKTLFQLHETVIGDGSGELGLHKLLHVVEVKPFETPEAAQLEQDHDGHHLRCVHPWFSFWFVANLAGRQMGIELNHELINN